MGSRRLALAAAVAVPLLSALAAPASAQPAACSGDNGGITLSPGFCATVFADKLGHARHLAVAPNGVVYVNTWSGRYFQNDTPPPGGFLIALQSTNNDGHADRVTRFGPSAADGNAGGTGIAIYRNYVYAETNDRIVRYPLPADGTVPTASPDTVVFGLPLNGDHPMHPFLIDPQGNLYVDLGSATNSCQAENRILSSKGINPCIELRTRAGTWRYDANKLNQHFSPAERFVTGLRNGEGISRDSAGRIFATQHGRDQLWQNFPNLYNAKQSSEEPAEELVQEVRGADFGWPECYYDYDQKKLVLAPEYNGNGGKAVGVCAKKREPVAAFPGHWAPNDMLIYEGSQFPSAYKDGAFIAFHGSWNRAPSPQEGYDVVFQPLRGGKASGSFVVFADGFAGPMKDPAGAAHRPTGLAVGPDGALYIADDKGGRVWRVTYTGGPANGIAPAAPAPKVETSSSGNPLPPEGIHPAAGLPIPPGGSPDQVALGDAIFHGRAGSGTCSGCHGGAGTGSSVGSDLTSGKWLWGDGSVESIIRTIDDGVPKPKEHNGAMPPKGGADLTTAQVTAVADYVWALGHKNSAH